MGQKEWEKERLERQKSEPRRSSFYHRRGKLPHEPRYCGCSGSDIPGRSELRSKSSLVVGDRAWPHGQCGENHKRYNWRPCCEAIRVREFPIASRCPERIPP